jgi:hypothetical protein
MPVSACGIPDALEDKTAASWEISNNGDRELPKQFPGNISRHSRRPAMPLVIPSSRFTAKQTDHTHRLSGDRTDTVFVETVANWGKLRNCGRSLDRL